MSKVDTPFGAHAALSYNGGDGLYRAERYRFKFDNGFGASVIRGGYTYGGGSGLWELAVLDADGHITYTTPLTNDVLGYLSESDVATTLDRIAALSAEASA